VRRKFWDIRDNYPTPCQEILDLIAELYTVERLIPQELRACELFRFPT
jgi:hypothetical protein